MKMDQHWLTKRDRAILGTLARKNPDDIRRLGAFNGGLCVFAGVVTVVACLVRGDWGGADWGVAMVAAGWIEIERARYMRIVRHLLRDNRAKAAAEEAPGWNGLPDPYRSGHNEP